MFGLNFLKKGGEEGQTLKHSIFPKALNLITGKQFSAMVISVHRIMYQEYCYFVGILEEYLQQENIFSQFLRVHAAEGLLPNEMLKNLGSEFLTGSAAEIKILPMKHFTQHQHTKNLTLWLCFKKFRSLHKLFCVSHTKRHLQKVITGLCSSVLVRRQGFWPSAWE